MSLYGEYLKERTNDEIIEMLSGFATYRYVEGGKTVYIVDIYTCPESRGEGYAGAMADKIAALAKEKGCTSMLGSVVPSAKGSTTSLRVLLAYGMRLDSAGSDFIFLRKDI